MSAGAEDGSDVTDEEFKQWAYTRAFDIISEGRYRKYLVQCKENGDAWVVPVNAAVAKVQSKVRTITGIIDGLDHVPFASLAAVCREVISNSGPPVRVREGLSTCSLTGVKAENCLDIGRSGARGTGADAPSRPTAKRRRGQHQQQQQQQQNAAAAPEGGDAHARQTSEILVLPKFRLFLVMLWFTVKIEHVVRNFTRSWLDGLPEADTASVQSLCDQFASNDSVLADMNSVFNQAWGHICRSLREHERTGFSPAVAPDG